MSKVPRLKMTDPWGNPRRGFSATTTINRKDFNLLYNNTLKNRRGDDWRQCQIQIDAEMVKKK